MDIFLYNNGYQLWYQLPLFHGFWKAIPRVSKIIIIVLTLKIRTPQPGIILKIKSMDLFFFFIKDVHASQIRNYYSTSLPIITTFLSSYSLEEKNHHLLNSLYMIFWLTNNYSMLRHDFFSKKWNNKNNKRGTVASLHDQDLKITQMHTFNRSYLGFFSYYILFPC